MYVYYKQERFFEIFARFLCHNLAWNMESVSFGVRDSQNEAQFAPSLCAPKNLFQATLNIVQNTE